MAFCPQCGAEAAGNFCPKCGAGIGAPAAGGYAAPGAQPNYPPPGAQPNYPPPGAQPNYPPPGAQPNYAGQPQAAGMSDGAAGALCYLLGLITGIIFLVIAPYNQNKTVRFHAFQSIFFHIAVIIIYIGLGMLTFFMGIITHGFGFIGLFFYPILGLAVFITWLFLMWSAYNNKMVVLPVIGDLARRQA